MTNETQLDGKNDDKLISVCYKIKQTTQTKVKINAIKNQMSLSQFVDFCLNKMMDHIDKKDTVSKPQVVEETVDKDTKKVIIKTDKELTVDEKSELIKKYMKDQNL